MQEIIGFLGLVVVISASGVMSPGPLFAANVMYGLREGKISGIKIAVGHTIVEFPLILLLGIGFFSIESVPEIRTTITVLGAIGLFGFAFLQIRRLCMVIHNCSIFIQSQKLSFKKEFQDHYSWIEYSFSLFWNRISIKIIKSL